MIPLDSWLGFETIALYGSSHESIGRRSDISFTRGADDLDDTWELALRLPSGRKVALVEHVNAPQVGTSIMFAGQRAVVPEVIRETMQVLRLHPRRLLWTAVPLDAGSTARRAGLPGLRRGSTGDVRPESTRRAALLDRFRVGCRKRAGKLASMSAKDAD